MLASQHRNVCTPILLSWTMQSLFVRVLDLSFCSPVSAIAASKADLTYLMILTSLFEFTLPIDPGVIKMNCFPIEYRAASICRAVNTVIGVFQKEHSYHLLHTDFPVDTIHEYIAASR